DELLRLASSDVRLRLVIRDHELDRSTVDTAGLVDAVDRHLRPDERCLATGRREAGERLQRAELEWLGLTKGASPRRRHRRRRAHAPCGRPAEAEEPAPADLAAVPEVLGPRLTAPSLIHIGVLLSGECR